MLKSRWLKYCNKNKPWVDEVPNQKADPYEEQRKCIRVVSSTRSIRSSIWGCLAALIMSWVFNFLKKIAIFANKAGISVRHSDLWNTIKSITLINNGSQRFENGDLLWHEKKLCHVSWETRINNSGEMEFWIIKPVTKSKPTISHG